jgi:hypothetical protein
VHRGVDLLRLDQPDPKLAETDREEMVSKQSYQRPGPEPLDDDDEDDYEPPAPSGP